MTLKSKDIFSKCERILVLLPICSHLLKKFLLENLIFLSSEFNLTEITKGFCYVRLAMSQFLEMLQKLIRILLINKNIHLQIRYRISFNKHRASK